MLKVEAIVAEKLYALSIGADQQKILRYLTKYALFFVHHFSLAHVLPRLQNPLRAMAPSLTPFCSAFILDEISDILLSTR